MSEQQILAERLKSHIQNHLPGHCKLCEDLKETVKFLESLKDVRVGT